MSSPVNIDSKGYGKIYKVVMRNRQLPLLAKTIYAYFCAYAGNGYQAYPKRDKIVRDLQMNKNTYTKHLNTLIAEGYIAKERAEAGNLYTIMRTVPSYEKPAPVQDDITDMLVLDSVSAQGFGIVPKILMLDTRLTAQAKGIYAYFSSFAGAGTTAFPRHSTIMRDLNLSHVTYYAHYNLLLNYGYLTVERRKINGKYAVSLYRLSDCVESPATAPAVPRKGNQKAMYEKLAHGKNGDTISNFADKGEPETPMSQKLAHGKMLKTLSPLSQKLSYEKPASEEMDSGNLGHRNINNKYTTNSFFEKEQGQYHQGGAPDDKNPVPLLSLAQAREIMRYEYWRCEAFAWGELKEKLGHFTTPGDKARYMQRIIEILDEMAKQAHGLLNTADGLERVVTMFESEAFAEFFDRIITHWNEIRSAKGYVSASLKKLDAQSPSTSFIAPASPLLECRPMSAPRQSS